MKGRKVDVFDLKQDKPAEKELLAVMLGSTGNLRAPTVVCGKTVLVGFNQDSLRRGPGLSRPVRV